MNVPKTIEQNGQRVLTTKTLAEMYGTSTQRISHNFSQNKKRYVEGKHFYYLTGESLKKFAMSNLDTANNGGKLYLWTERGALFHAKSLNTDKAWEVYDFLVEHYFRSASMDDIMEMTAEQMLEDAQKRSRSKGQKRIAELRTYHELKCSADLAQANAAIAQIKLLEYLSRHPECMESVSDTMLSEVKAT